MDAADRHIVLGMPYYGKLTFGAGRGFWRASRNPGLKLIWSEGSLLACNMNQLWASALNWSHQGTRVDYFAMLHDDIGPEDWWLDTLIDELESKQLDVLSVVVPIKDQRGVTSTALRDHDNPWAPYAKLTMDEVYRLPETFTEDDTGSSLLLNSGCWVAKWDQDWCRKVHFEINDRIAFNTAINRYQPQVESEDWFFSRCLQDIDMGLRIGATRKISVIHAGGCNFSNDRVWGSEKWDGESRLTESPIKTTSAVNESAEIPLEV
jgi:hypothetical protein